MPQVTLSNYRAALFAVSVLVAACSQNLNPSSSTTISGRQADSNIVLQKTKASDDLVYLGTYNPSSLDAFEFPDVKVAAGQISTAPQGVCADKKGNVWVSTSSGMDEYAHGGTEPIAQLSLQYANGCAVDRSSGDLAVALGSGSGNDGGVAIFRKAKGTPKIISLNFAALYCGYDSAGDILLEGDNTGFKYAELTRGSQSPTTVSVSFAPYDIYPSGIQWDGKYFVLGYQNNVLYRASVSGGSATLVSQVSVIMHINMKLSDFWIQKKAVVVAGYNGFGSMELAVFPYPKGGRSSHETSLNAIYRGIAVSVGNK